MDFHTVCICYLFMLCLEVTVQQTVKYSLRYLRPVFGIRLFFLSNWKSPFNATLHKINNNVPPCWLISVENYSDVI